MMMEHPRVEVGLAFLPRRVPMIMARQLAPAQPALLSIFSVREGWLLSVVLSSRALRRPLLCA